MKRPNRYSKPLGGVRKDSYHPADLNNQYEKDLNTYIDYLEALLKKTYSEEDLQEAFYSRNENWIDYEEWFEQFKKK